MWPAAMERPFLPQSERTAPVLGMEDLLTTTLRTAEGKGYFVSGHHNNLTEEDVALKNLPVESVDIYSVSVIVSLFGLIGNGIVLWYLGFRIHRNPLTVYIFNLAVVHFIFFFFFSVVAIIFLLSLHGLTRQTGLYEILEALYMFGFLTTQCLLAAVSVEWCVSAWCPVWYKRRRDKHQSSTICAMVWILCIISVVAWHLFCSYTYRVCLGIYIAHSVLDVLICIPLMLLSSLTLLIKICRRPHGCQLPKLYILLFTTVLSFLLLAVPVKLVLFMNVTLRNFAAAILCFCINSSLNPVIYFLVGSFRKWRLKSSIPGALQKAFQDEPDPAVPGENVHVQRRCLPA
ncbi:mas-related G-protein coupled receptor member H-like [Ambystoma mexicanum]|uniref:mas-related G-protein coupled receptor member H-like n=1 Tax=Ambystoma mexicanum TaxID=8296 RepID=UPI0037E86ABF